MGKTGRAKRRRMANLRSDYSANFKKDLLSEISIFVVFAQTPSIFALRYFSLFKLKVFSNRLSLVCLSFQVM